MKTKENAKDKDKKQLLLENQNIHDFNPSQYVEDNDVDKKKKKEKDIKKKTEK